MREERKGNSTKELSAEDALKYMRIIEESKVTSITKLQKAVAARQINPQHFPVLMEVEKTKAFDQLFLSDGIEESDISAAFTNHDIENLPEYKSLVAEMQAKL